MTYISKRVLFQGKYGPIDRMALNSYNVGIKRARGAYAAQPFERKIDNDAARMPTPRPQDPWTPVEDRYLKKAYRNGKTYEHIGKHLNRTPRACQGRASSLGITRRR